VEAVIAVVVFVAWVIWEFTEKHPVVDLSLFKSSNFTIGTAIFCLAYATFFGSAVLMPLWLQTQMGYIATWAGLVAAPSGVIAVLLTPFIARLIGRIDARWVATAAIGALAYSLYMRSQYGPDADFLELVMPMLVMGIGMSGFFISMVTICLNGVPGPQVPQASGLSNFARITAGAFAASITTTWWDNSAAQHQTRLAETVGTPGDPLWAQALHTLQQHGATTAQAFGSMTQQVVHQAYFLATMDLFRVNALLTFALLPFIWLTKPARSQGHTAAAD
jgi:DHA2 family multidrug resistance protein